MRGGSRRCAVHPRRPSGPSSRSLMSAMATASSSTTRRASSGSPSPWAARARVTAVFLRTPRVRSSFESSRSRSVIGSSLNSVIFGGRARAAGRFGGSGGSRSARRRASDARAVVDCGSDTALGLSILARYFHARPVADRHEGPSLIGAPPNGAPAAPAAVVVRVASLQVQAPATAVTATSIRSDRRRRDGRPAGERPTRAGSVHDGPPSLVVAVPRRRYSGEMQPLRYSINITLDGCCDHRGILPDEELHRHAVENLNRADALAVRPGDLRDDGVGVAAAGHGSVARLDGSVEIPSPRPSTRAKKYVVSSTLEQVDWNAELVRGDLGEAVQRLKRSRARACWWVV